MKYIINLILSASFYFLIMATIKIKITRLTCLTVLLDHTDLAIYGSNTCSDREFIMSQCKMLHLGIALTLLKV